MRPAHPVMLEEARPPARLWLVPVCSTVAASLGALLPVAAAVPLLPPFGFLVLVGWRLRRPELWPAWVGLPLGLADDLVTGSPLGSAMVLWTLALIAVDAVDHRILFRERHEDWALAAALIGGEALGGWALARLAGAAGPPWTALPPALLGILCFPLAARACALFDRVRLRARRG